MQTKCNINLFKCNIIAHQHQKTAPQMLLAMVFTFHIALQQLFVPLFTLSIFHTQWFKSYSLWYIPANKFG